MNKDRNVSFDDPVSLEKYYGSLETSRTSSPRKHNEMIRNHLIDVLENKFCWDYWITITFGYNPDLEEVEDILYKLHHRIDLRILKHRPDTRVMNSEDRSEWIMFPELKGRGLHYHGFIKLNTKPFFKEKTYENEWSWMRTAFNDTLKDLNMYLSTGGFMEFRLFERKWRWKDDLKMIIYSMKEFCEGTTHYELNNDFDRIAYTIISRDCWKPTPLHKGKSPTKIDRIPVRPNKSGGLSEFF